MEARLFGYNHSMKYRWLAICIALLLPATAALAQQSPEDTVREHFAAITAEEYVQADQYFSTAFLRAFKTEERASVDQYYLTRRAQLACGYEIMEVMELADVDRETVRITVEFGDPYPEAPVGITERLYYYLIRQKVDNDAPLANPDNRAWRIDIFDALSHDTLAAARRRPYLYTRESWDEDESRELKSRQGLFRIQLALSRYYEDHGQFPFRLRGGDNRRDELISGGYLQERYPPCGFSNRPMEVIEFGKKSSGDLAYYSIDADGDSVREGYWMLLHGKVRESYYFSGYDTVYIMNSSLTGTQFELAGLFAQFWIGRAGEYLTISEALAAQVQPAHTGSWITPLHTAPATLPLPQPAPADQAIPLQQIAGEETTGDGRPVVQDTPIVQTGVSVTETPVDHTGAVPVEPEPADMTGQLPTVREILAISRANQTAGELRLVVSSFLPETMAAAGVNGGELELLLPPTAERLTVHAFGW